MIQVERWEGWNIKVLYVLDVCSSLGNAYCMSKSRRKLIGLQVLSYFPNTKSTFAFVQSKVRWLARPRPEENWGQTWTSNRKADCARLLANGRGGRKQTGREHVQYAHWCACCECVCAGLEPGIRGCQHTPLFFLWHQFTHKRRWRCWLLHHDGGGLGRGWTWF